MLGNSLNYITFDFLRTFTGAVFVTNIISHFLKDYLPESLDSKIITLCVATFITFTNLLVFSQINSETIYLSVINSFFVAAAATGNYEILTKETKRGKFRQMEAEKRALQKEKSEDSKV